QLMPGLENRVYILTSYPDGAPARTIVTGSIENGQIETDASGVAIVTLKAANGPIELNLKATDSKGRSAQTNVKLQSQVGSQSLMLRTNKSVYKVGEKLELELETISTKPRGAIYLDVVKDGQTLITRAIESKGNRGDFTLDLTPSMFGTIEVRAYQIMPDADPISDRRLVYVDPADDLKVEASVEHECYAPGEDASINFRVTDKMGRPVSAALGIEIVDEAVFALSDKHPGFEKVFMYLEKELLTPRYEVHQFSFESVVINDFDGDKPLEARESTARVLLAAAATARNRDIRAEFGRGALEAKRNDYAALYQDRVFQKTQVLAKAMTEYYERRAAAPEGFGRDIESFVSEDRARRQLLEDPWGSALIGEGTLNDSGPSWVTVRSAGPDRRDKTADDIAIAIYAQRSLTRVASTQSRGRVNVSSGTVAGGRVSIEGVVKDGTGNPIAGVGIAAERVSDARTLWGYTDSEGRFSIANLAPGKYRLRFESKGSRSTFYRTLSLEAGQRGTVAAIVEINSIAPVTLAVYSANGGITFTGGVAGIAGGRFEKGKIENLPLNGRDHLARAQLEPGVAGKPLAAPLANEELRSRKLDQKDSGDNDGSPRVRTFFPETLYTNPALITDGQGRASIRIPLADSITTWRVTSLASTTRGALGSSSSPLRVFQDFFVDLDLPVSATEGDALSVPVAVYNYLTGPQRVSLELRQDPWFTLDSDVAAKQVEVKAGEVTVAYFRIKTSRIGEHQLQVTAKLENAPAGQKGDAVARTLNVLPNGEEHAVVINERLEGEATKEILIPDSAIADASKIFVKFYPGALSQAVEGLDSILRMPGGCFEQTSSSTYPNVLVMDYLKASKKITPEIQAKAEGYISLGYQRLVTFEVKGGGFSWFGEAPANKILTAYGLMEFSDMSRVHEVDPRLIERTQAWLAGQQQQDGSFKPDTYFINEGATNRYNNDIVRITAYLGWALASTGYKGEAIDKAKQFVSSHVTGNEDAYTLAVIANFAADYARDRDWTDAAIKALAAKATEDQMTAHWKQEGETPTSARNDSADLETTALAAQAMLKSGQKSGLAKKALDYLTAKKDAMGNWQTTQATILALKAFALSFTKGASADTAGTIVVFCDGKAVEHVQITKDNNDLLHLIDLKGYTHQGAHKIGLAFSGHGSMQYQIVGRYYTPWALRAGGAAAEALSISVSYDRTKLAQDETATARVRVQNNTRALAKMIMVDLGIPPGFEVSRDELEALVDSTRGKSGGKLEKYTITGKQVILYFDGLNAKQVVGFSYKLRAKFPVRAQTFSSRVYEYYNPAVEDKAKPVEMTVVAR
ncbi:MAG TPA: alpha-2-macroglobulin family protein, partial [Blastocatellia bacterium]|nr:alpha-2-macroglobulin family protein [Blastocatellia bacterium]